MSLLPVGTAHGADPEPRAPLISPLDQRFLTRVVRRTMEQQLRDGTLYQTDYVPPTLRDIECQAIVTLRQHGHLRGVGSGGRGPVVTTCRDAAIAALADAARTGPVTDQWLSRVCIDVETAGDPLPVRFTGRWSDVTAFNACIEPGIHGVLLQHGQARRQFSPSEIITKNITVHEAILRLAQQLVEATEQLADVTVSRFRTTHWHETRPGGDTVELRRGLLVLDPEAVTDESLAEAIDRLAAYMIYRQLPNGLFSYQYEPSVDSYTEDDNLVRQAGVAWALAHHASVYGRSASAAAADLAIQRLARRVVDLPGDQGTADTGSPAFVAGLEGHHKLGITALSAMAMFDHPEAAKYREVRGRLVDGVHAAQTSSGMFITAFPPVRKLSSQYYFPGEALMAIARDYEEQPTQRAINAFSSAFDYYRRLFREDPTPPFAAWHIQAFSRMAAPTKRRDYAEFVFEMTDWLLDRQYDQTNCPWPELYGGVEAYRPSRVGVATASYLEGFSDALRLASSVGDGPRVERYERAVRLAARFVMQLQFRPAEAYYVRSLPDTIGGIRTSPSNNVLRIDHCQHALLALMKTRQVLYAD
ncbi:MAG: AMMECR1 domain-containing protein [Planctomycetota bacterium]